jgi:hypothetical protein
LQLPPPPPLLLLLLLLLPTGLEMFQDVSRKAISGILTAADQRRIKADSDHVGFDSVAMRAAFESRIHCRSFGGRFFRYPLSGSTY